MPHIFSLLLSSYGKVDKPSKNENTLSQIILLLGSYFNQNHTCLQERKKKKKKSKTDWI